MACSHEVTVSAGKFRGDIPVKKLLRRAWQRPSAGGGATGHRSYDWAAIDLTDPRPATPQPLGTFRASRRSNAIRQDVVPDAIAAD